MSNPLKKTLSFLILVLVIGQSFFPVYPSCPIVDSDELHLAGEYAGTSQLFSVCYDISLSVQHLTDAASSESRLQRTGDLPVNDYYTLMAVSYAPVIRYFNLSQGHMPNASSHVPDRLPLYALHILLLSMMIFFAGKFSAYLPRSGIDALFTLDTIRKNPHWFIKINEGFSFVYNHPINGGRYV